jgi:hypothetical protein
VKSKEEEKSDESSLRQRKGAEVVTEVTSQEPADEDLNKK